MKRAVYIVCMSLCLLIQPLRAEQQILRMEAAVSPTDIFQGEAVQLTLFVHGYRPELGQPDLNDLPADIQLIGQQDRSQHSIQIVNGRQQVTQLSGRSFTYRVTPHEPGRFAFEPITLQGPDGQPLPVNSPSINVRPIPQQDHVQLWIHAPTNQIIVDEEFDVSLFIRIRKPTRPFHNHSPIPEGTSPHLHVPFLDLHPGEGLQSENITQLLQRLLAREGESFHINNRVIGRDPFGGMFGRDQAARFRLPRTTDPDNENYYLYELRSRWAADREGNYTFGPAGFRGSVITHVTPEGNASQETIYAVSDLVTVQVRTPPAQGRPATFIGASGIGFTIETSLDTQVCQTGDPVTLTIEITGDGSPNRIRSPRPSTLTPLEQDFRLQPDPIRSESISGGRRFSYLIRPRVAGTREIPALEISYFNLETRSYQTVQSDPLPIRVHPATELDYQTITDAAPRSRMRFSFSAPPGELPPAPFTLQPATISRIFHPAWHIPSLLLGPIVFAWILLAQWLPKHIPVLQAHIQRKKAHQRALLQLHPEAGNPNPVKVLRNFLVTTIDPIFAKGDTHRMRQILEERGMPRQDIDTLIRMLTETAYTGTQAQDHHREDALHCIETLACLRTPHVRHARWSVSSKTARNLIFLLATAGLTLSVVADQVLRFEERRTQLLLLRAQEPVDFLTAANALADRIDQGERSPVILYNLGTALLLADQPALAVPILQWAERRGAPSWDVRRNMLVARRMINQSATLQLPWIRNVLFWHYRIPLAHRVTIAALLFSLIWILESFRRVAKRRTWSTLPALIFFILFGVSVAVSMYAEFQNEQDWQMQRRQMQRMLTLLQEENEP